MVINKKEQNLLFKGCNDFNGVGEEPYGRLLIDSLMTPTQVKDSGSFKVEIFKDKALTKKIAYLEQGGFLKATDLQPGWIKKLKISPLNPGVGKKTGHRVTFDIIHSISDNGKIRVIMPAFVNIGKVGSTVVIKPVDNSIVARKGTVMKDNVIEIINVFGTTGEKNSEAPQTIDFIIEGTQNPSSTKPAGKW